MKSLDENLKNLDIKKLFKHPRLKMLDEFYRRINAERKASDMEELPMRAIGVKTSHLSIDDLGYLLKKCQQSMNFSRTFFGLLKIKDDDKK
ncbi:MAG: hypothetical protein HYT68_01930 [Candidatus Zambryskibacteria bacterium]|nr:hypothetical protein [Candidatus Zambryskibacteria bacterium]